MELYQELCREIEERKEEMVQLCSEMVKIPSETPPSDTRRMADYVSEYIRKEIKGAEVCFYEKEPPVKNLVVKIDSGNPGKRLVFNGHLDTYPVGNQKLWSQSPWSGSVKDGFVWGRGSSDMKGGIACFITAARVLAEHKELWKGEVVLTLAGDEEAMGDRGTQYLLDTVKEASGDAMICADVGAPDSLRFGQKGLLWIRLDAVGKSAHGAHLHKGVSAINRLIEVIRRVNSEVSALEVNMPEDVRRAILDGAGISEQGAGPGETQILQKVTVNFGTIKGGTSPNLVPDSANAEADIRIPAGVSIADITKKIEEILAETEGVTYTVLRAYEANWSDPADVLFQIVKEKSEEVLQKEVVVTFRVGASDARLYRLGKDIPTINCGLTPYGLGGPDEHVSVDEMVKIAKIHLLSALEFLNLYPKGTP